MAESCCNLSLAPHLRECDRKHDWDSKEQRAEDEETDKMIEKINKIILMRYKEAVSVYTKAVDDLQEEIEKQTVGQSLKWWVNYLFELSKRITIKHNIKGYGIWHFTVIGGDFAVNQHAYAEGMFESRSMRIREHNIFVSILFFAYRQPEKKENSDQKRVVVCINQNCCGSHNLSG